MRQGKEPTIVPWSVRYVVFAVRPRFDVPCWISGCLLALVLTAPFSMTTTFAAEFTGTVIRVSSGDTITVKFKGESRRVRIAGIDCPDLGQPFGAKARTFTSTLVMGKKVDVHWYGVNQSRRIIGEVALIDGRAINELLVQEGLAWRLEDRMKGNSLVEKKKEAGAAALGLAIFQDRRMMNDDVVAEGLAWWHQKNTKNNRLREIEGEAQAAKKGLWVQPQPVPPWEWRKAQEGAP